MTAFDQLSRPEQAAGACGSDGFLIATFGPFAMALLHGWSGSVMHLACIAVVALLYAGFDPARYADAMMVGELQNAVSPA